MDQDACSVQTSAGYSVRDVAEIARLHMDAFPDFFLSSLGLPFLEEFYRFFISDPSSVTVVARDGDRIVGAAVGTTSPSGFYSRMIRRRGFHLGVLAARRVLNDPSTAGRLFDALWYRGGVEGAPENAALLSSICVDPQNARSGVGRLMLERWCEIAKSRGVVSAYLTTDAIDNAAANGFYVRSGWSLFGSYDTKQGRLMNAYSLTLDGVSRSSKRKVVMVEAYEKAFINFRERLAIELVEAGHDVIALAPEFSPEIRGILLDRGMTPIEFSMDRTSVNPLRDMQTITSIREILAREKPDTLVSFGPKPVIYSGLALRSLPGIRSVAVVTGLGYAFTGTETKARVVRRIQNSLYSRALPMYQSVIFQNPDDRKLFVEDGLVDSGLQHVGEVNGSGVDTNRFQPAGAPPVPPVFLFLGRLQASKGLNEFLVAARRVKSQHPHVTFRVVGWHDPSNPHALSPKAFEWLKGTSEVEYDGASVDVHADLAASSVLVLPSYREGQPRSVLEAMAVGRAIITTDAPGCRETVDDGVNGYMVPVGDIDTLERAMMGYVSEPELLVEHGVASLARVEMKYRVEDVNAVIRSSMLCG